MNTPCPFCDSNEVKKITIEETFTIPFCEDAVIPHETFKCNACEEEGDFDNSLDKALTSDIDKANLMSAPELINKLTEDGITMTYLEKALRLPFRTTSRWKRGEISRSALALLRFIRFSPQLLEVADDNFSDKAIMKYQFERPCDFFEKETSNTQYHIDIGYKEVKVSYTGALSSSTDTLGQEAPREIPS